MTGRVVSAGVLLAIEAALALLAVLVHQGFMAMYAMSPIPHLRGSPGG
jgi:hypothetical protein